MKALVIAAGLILVSASPGLAQLDPEPDSIGLFFDEAYTFPCLCSDATGPFPLYLVASEISCAGGLAGWEAMVSLTPESTGLFFLSATLSGTGPIMATTPPEFQVVLGVPMPQAPDLLLATLNYFATGPAAACFRIHPIRAPSLPGECSYVDGAVVDRLVPFVPPNTWLGPAAFLNTVHCQCPHNLNCEGQVVTKVATWGAVKSMFR